MKYKLLLPGFLYVSIHVGEEYQEVLPLGHLSPHILPCLHCSGSITFDKMMIPLFVCQSLHMRSPKGSGGGCSLNFNETLAVSPGDSLPSLGQGAKASYPAGPRVVKRENHRISK